jgi:hypothetical protein
MQQQLFTNWNGNNMYLVVNKITALVTNNNNTEETLVFVVGSDNPFKCSEPCDLLSKELKMCLMDE